MMRSNPKPILAILMVLIMCASGCLGLADSENESYEMADTDLGDIVKRSIGSPNLEQFSTCEELEVALKIRK